MVASVLNLNLFLVDSGSMQKTKGHVDLVLPLSFSSAPELYPWLPES